MEPLKCPKCGKPMQSLQCGTPSFVSVSLEFSKREGKYIPCMDIVEYADYFVCEHCGEVLDKALVIEHTNFQAVIIKPWGIKKALRINFEDLRYDTKYVEFAESLPQTIGVSEEENEAEKEKKE